MQTVDSPVGSVCAEVHKAGPSKLSDCQTLYTVNIHSYITEGQLQDLLSSMGSMSAVKVIKDKATGLSAGYGFIKFVDHM